MSDSRWIEFGSPAWQKLLSTVAHDFYHLPEYVALEAGRLNGEPELFAYHEQRSSFLCPLVFRGIEGLSGRDAISPYGYPGPLASDGAEVDFVSRASRALGEAMSERNLVSAFIRLHPLLSPDPETLTAIGRTVRHGSTVSIDLRVNEAEMWAGIRHGHRSEIKRGKERSFEFALDPTWRDLEEFLSIYQETMTAVQAKPEYFFDRDYFESLRDLTGARTYLATVRIDFEPAAAAIFTEVDGLVQYHLSGARGAFRRQQPTKYLIDQVRRWAAAKGHHTLHLGGGVGSREDGLFKFKAGFSKKRHVFSTWRIVPDPVSYEDLCSTTGVEGEGDFFPAYRAPR